MKEKALISPGDVVAPAITWLNTNAHGLFQAISIGVEAVLGVAEAALTALPAPLMAALIVGLVLWRLGVGMASLAASCLAASRSLSATPLAASNASSNCSISCTHNHIHS
mgnify:CR=1 FL=1